MTQEEHIAEARPLIEHFRELRRRLMVSLIAFALAVSLSYYYAADIYRFLVQPLADGLSASGGDRRMIYTSLTEPFFTYLKLAMFAGFLLSFPVLAAQLYLFLAPGLYKRERFTLLPYLIAAPVLFTVGAAFCYYFIFPTAWAFFIGFESAGGEGALPIKLEARVGEYLSLVMQLILAFGLSFQLPVILTLLTLFGWVSPAALARGRRFAVVIIVTMAAILTPPDIFSQVALSVPLYALYEISIMACRVIERRKALTEDGNGFSLDRKP